ncbi:CheY-like chemotaxis protein [Pontibacter mucosus]|uniref:CheY-like chemotaxis protein n=1 Tax=Pontibacter mucosus TaxID=1649266 RepID=A0A2T5YGK9_9BACT|nr:response regulator [Pontibacter mucosus]PTX18439.1 CheY-like chemotaxis protein [Pontibacter mucosus]
MYNKVFIVDDDEVSIFLTETILEAESFATECRGFLDAQQALQSLLESAEGNEEALPEVIFLDLNMPFLSGWDFIEALAPYEEALKGRCRIYILTSSVDEQERRRANSSSLVAGFLQKPLEDQWVLQLKRSY